MNGVILINKPKQMTSHDVVSKIRKIYQTKKVGHAGTLDPMATGVLPILIGQGTKISKYLIEHDKTYNATIKLGIKTTTGDLEGEITKTKAVPQLTEEMVENILQKFKGKQKQIPPMYSAIKINGKKLYEYARQGETIEIEPREIEIYDIKLKKLQKDEISYEVSCSKGTYIRVLCEQIAEELQTIGTMKELTRIRVNQFLLSQTNTIEELEQSNDKENKIVKIENIFEKEEKIILTQRELQLFLNGVQLTNKNKNGVYRIYDESNKFIGLGIIQNELLKRDVII